MIFIKQSVCRTFDKGVGLSDTWKKLNEIIFGSFGRAGDKMSISLIKIKLVFLIISVNGGSGPRYFSASFCWKKNILKLTSS